LVERVNMPSSTAPTDPNGNTIAFTIASVPEPSTWILAMIATVAVPPYLRARRHPVSPRRAG
jgi:hypothetical protein